MPPKRKKLVEGGEGPDGHAYYVDGDHIVHYGAGCRRLYRMTKADRGVVKGGVPVLLTEEFVENLIREHMRKETRNTGSRLSMEAADVSNEAALVAMPSGSMEERRAKRSFPSLNSDGRPERNTRAEREKALRRSWTDDLDLLDVEGDMLYKEIITSRPLSEGGVAVDRAVSTLANALTAPSDVGTGTHSEEYVRELALSAISELIDSFEERDMGRSLVAATAKSQSVLNTSMTKKEYAKASIERVFRHHALDSALMNVNKLLAELASIKQANRVRVGQLQRSLADARKLVPGAMSKFVISRARTSAESTSVPASTQRRHLSVLSNKLRELSREDPSRQRMYVSALAGMLESDGGGLSTRDAEDNAAIKDALYGSMCEVLEFLQPATGRPTNHIRGVRNVLLTTLSHKIPSHLRRHAARSMGGFNAHDLTSRANDVSKLLAGDSELWFSTRGQVRSSGLYGKTPVANLEAASLYWEASSVPSANKKDLTKNPKDKTETRIASYNYEHLSTKHLGFTAAMRKTERSKWEEESKEIDRLVDGGVVVVSLFSAVDPFFILVELDQPLELCRYRQDDRAFDLSVFNGAITADSDRSWVIGHLVVRQPPPNSRTLQATLDRVAVPVLAIRHVISPVALQVPSPAGEAELPPRTWRVQRVDWGMFQMAARIFVMALSIFIACRPWHVKEGTRETCLCIYHLRWDLICEGMQRWLKRHRRSSSSAAAAAAAVDGVDDDDGDPVEGHFPLKQTLRAPGGLRRSLMCVEAGGFAKPECIENKCKSCSQGSLFNGVLSGSGILPSGVIAKLVQGSDEADAEDELGDDVTDAGVDVPNDGGDEEPEENVPLDGDGDDDALDPLDPKNIEFDQWTKIEYRTASGEKKTKWDFRTVVVTLLAFWTHVFGYFYRYVAHHDLAKWCDGEWQHLKSNFRRGEVCLVMDASEAHKHSPRREHQSYYFAQVSSTLWVVVYRFHLQDLGNIDPEEKLRLLEYFDKLGIDPIIRETHYYVTADKEKDQGQVQYILTDVANYLRGRGRWSLARECSACGFECDEELEDNTCTQCGGVYDYFQQPNLDRNEKADAEYYQGRGAPAEGVSFKWIKAFSDGCAAQFMCAAFFLFISSFVLTFGIFVVWNWFCSCHGKCDCDPEGGAFKTSADEYEALDSALTDRRQTIRNSWELVQFGRDKLTMPSKDFYSKNGKGVLRRFTHHIPMRGSGAIQRRLVRKADPDICQFGTTTKIPIRSFRRIATDGFTGSLLASERPCCRSDCPCMGGGLSGVHDFSQCKTSKYTKVRHIQIDPLSVVHPTPARGALAFEGARLGLAAALCDKMAIETQSDETPFWVIEVTGLAQDVPLDYVCPLTTSDHVDVVFEFPRNKKALTVRRLRPVVTRRGESSVRQLQYDPSLPPFLVPCHLLRVGKLKLVEVAVAPARTSARLAPGGGGGPVAPRIVHFELSAADKANVLERCRVFGD